MTELTDRLRRCRIDSPAGAAEYDELLTEYQRATGDPRAGWDPHGEARAEGVTCSVDGWTLAKAIEARQTAARQGGTGTQLPLLADGE